MPEERSSSRYQALLRRPNASLELEGSPFFNQRRVNAVVCGSAASSPGQFAWCGWHQRLRSFGRGRPGTDDSAPTGVGVLAHQRSPSRTAGRIGRAPAAAPVRARPRHKRRSSWRTRLTPCLPVGRNIRPERRGSGDLEPRNPSWLGPPMGQATPRPRRPWCS